MLIELGYALVTMRVEVGQSLKTRVWIWAPFGLGVVPGQVRPSPLACASAIELQTRPIASTTNAIPVERIRCMLSSPFGGGGIGCRARIERAARRPACKRLQPRLLRVKEKALRHADFSRRRDRSRVRQDARRRGP